MTFKPLTLLWTGFVVGCLIGTATTAGVLYHRTRLNALWTWWPVNNTAPVGKLFLHRPVLGDRSLGRCYVATYGPPEACQRSGAKVIPDFLHLRHPQ